MSGSGPLLIAVGGGKGGVGKSVVSLNLAYALSQLGSRVLLVDADLGAANLHSMCGIDHPGATLQAFIDKRVETLEELIMPTGYRGLSLVPGSGAVLGAANIGHGQKVKLLRHIRKLDSEVVVIDVGAGVNFNAIDFYSVADLQLTVARPQLTSLQNGYSFLKGAVFRRFAEMAREENLEDLFTRSTTRGETERVTDLIGRIASENEALANRMRASLRARRGGIIGNQMESPGQANVLHALSRMLRDFLGVESPVLAALCTNTRINRSVTKRMPFLSEKISDADATALLTLAERLLEMGAQTPRSEAEELQAMSEELVTSGVHEAPLQASSAPVNVSTATPEPVVVAPLPRPVSARVSVPDAAPAIAQARISTPADGAPPARGLDGHLHRYLRKNDRYDVGWSAIIRTGFDTQPGRVQDISLGGASIKMRTPASALDELVIVFDSLPGRPEFQCRVRYVDSMNGRCGVEFYGEAARNNAERLVALAVSQGCRMVPDVRTYAA